jgi:hypothetical protein
VFPHILPADSLATASVVRATPFMDNLEVAFALRGIDALSLGRGPQTDLLALSLSATDLIGHRYGPDSREIHDQIVRLDRVLGTFMDSLYRLRDSSRVLIVLTGDHGVGTMPELAPATMRPVPTHVSLRDLRLRLDTALIAAKVDPQAIVLEEFVVADRAAFRRAGVSADSVLAALATAIRAVPGVARVDDFGQLLADTLRDPIARRWAHQFPPSANIELVVTLTPLSLWGNAIADAGGDARSAADGAGGWEGFEALTALGRHRLQRLPALHRLGDPPLEHGETRLRRGHRGAIAHEGGIGQ